MNKKQKEVIKEIKVHLEIEKKDLITILKELKRKRKSWHTTRKELKRICNHYQRVLTSFSEIDKLYPEPKDDINTIIEISKLHHELSGENIRYYLSTYFQRNKIRNTISSLLMNRKHSMNHFSSNGSLELQKLEKDIISVNEKIKWLFDTLRELRDI